jgi:putative ABC transport system ATP-binding protein
MASLGFREVSKRFNDGTLALAKVNLEVEHGEFMVLVGPSGCGKTTLLRSAAGLEEITSGEIRLGGKVVTDVDPSERDVAMVFQNYALYPHMTVRQNLAFGLEQRRLPRAEIAKRVAATAGTLGLERLLDRKPAALSGGQRQRVAVARALVNRPKLILADEPTASLDKESSSTVVTLLKELTTNEGCTVIMVTHDNRILELADRIVNMVDGHIVSDVILREALTVCEFLRGVELFKKLTPSEIANVADRMHKRKYARGDVVVRQGERGEEFFLIARGGASVRVQKPGEPEREVATLGPGDIFGEMALLTEEPRNATVSAVDELETYYLDKEGFREALALSTAFKDQVRQVYFDRFPTLRRGQA